MRKLMADAALAIEGLGHHRRNVTCPFGFEIGGLAVGVGGLEPELQHRRGGETAADHHHAQNHRQADVARRQARDFRQRAAKKRLYRD